jgi:hypothetical protein
MNAANLQKQGLLNKKNLEHRISWLSSAIPDKRINYFFN